MGMCMGNKDNKGVEKAEVQLETGKEYENPPDDAYYQKEAEPPVRNEEEMSLFNEYVDRIAEDSTHTKVYIYISG